MQTHRHWKRLPWQIQVMVTHDLKHPETVLQWTLAQHLAADRLDVVICEVSRTVFIVRLVLSPWHVQAQDSRLESRCVNATVPVRGSKDACAATTGQTGRRQRCVTLWMPSSREKGIAAHLSRSPTNKFPQRHGIHHADAQRTVYWGVKLLALRSTTSALSMATRTWPFSLAWPCMKTTVPAI